MPRAEGKRINLAMILQVLTHVHSWNAKVLGQQDEIQRPAAPAVVLPSLRETVQRREWIQMSCPVRGASPPNARRGRACWQTHLRLFLDVPARLCTAAVQAVSAPVVRSHSVSLFTDTVDPAGLERRESLRTEYIRRSSSTRSMSI